MFSLKTVFFHLKMYWGLLNGLSISLNSNPIPSNSHVTTHTSHTSAIHCQSLQQQLQLQYTNGDITKTITTTSSVTANIVKSDSSSDNIVLTGDFDNVIVDDVNSFSDIKFDGDVDQSGDELGNHFGDHDRQEGGNIVGYEHLWQLGTPGIVIYLDHLFTSIYLSMYLFNCGDNVKVVKNTN